MNAILAVLLPLLKEAIGYLKAIANRLAPANPTQQIVKFYSNQDVPGTVKTIQLSGPFNVMLNDLQAGQVKVFFGNGTASMAPDFTFNPVNNPEQYNIGARTDRTVVFIVSPGAPAKGTIHLEFY